MGKIFEKGVLCESEPLRFVIVIKFSHTDRGRHVGEAILDKMFHQGEILNAMPLHNVFVDDKIGIISENLGPDVR